MAGKRCGTLLLTTSSFLKKGSKMVKVVMPETGAPQILVAPNLVILFAKEIIVFYKKIISSTKYFNSNAEKFGVSKLILMQ